MGIVALSNGGPLQISLADDIANKAVIIGEAVGSTTQDPAVSSITSNTSLFDSQIVKVSYELLNDSNWDIQSWLSGVFNDRMLRGLSGAVTAGATNFSSLNTAALVKEPLHRLPRSLTWKALPCTLLSILRMWTPRLGL